MSYKLLVIDDEESILFAMSEYFRLYGCDVDIAQEREEAEALISHCRYSAIIADLRLTGSYGTEGLQIISDVRQRCPGTLIILLTAYGSREIERDARTRGVDVILHKPKPLAEIAQIVFALLGRENVQSLFA
jgi:DNA-binding response OmpR family regulator